MVIVVSGLDISTNHNLIEDHIDPDDYIATNENTIEEFYKASGAGGQHRNKVETAVRLLHVPTEIMVTCADERTQIQNRKIAWKNLQQTLDEAKSGKQKHLEDQKKREQFKSLSNPWTWVGYRDEVKRPDGEKTSMSKTLKGKLGKILQM